MRLITESEKDQWKLRYRSWKSSTGIDMQKVDAVTLTTANAKKLLEKSVASSVTQLLVHQLTNDSLQLDQKNAKAQKLSFPFWQNKSVDVVVIPVLRNGTTAGHLSFVDIPQSPSAEARVKNTDGTSTIYMVRQRELNTMLLDAEGNPLATTIPEAQNTVVAVDSSSCQTVCTAVCGRYGVLESLAECTAACAVTGAGELLCDPLCFAIMTFGCWVGCGYLCSVI